MANPSQPFGGFGTFTAPSGASEAQKPGMSSFSFGAQGQASTGAGGLLSAGASSQPFGQSFGQGLAKPATTAPTAFSLGSATSVPPSTSASAASTSLFGFAAPGGTFSLGGAGLPVAGPGGASTSGSGSAMAPAFGLSNANAATTQGGFSFGASAAPSIGFGTTPATAATTLNSTATSTGLTTVAGISAPATASGGSLFGSNAPATSSVGFKLAGTGLSSFGFSTPASAAPSFGPAVSATPAAGGGGPTFGFVGSAPAGSGASTGIAPSFGQTTASASLSAPTPSLASILSSTPAPSFSIATGLTSTSGPTLSFGTSITAATPSSFTSSSGARPVVPSMTAGITTPAITATTATVPSFGLGSSLNSTATTAVGLGFGSSLSLSATSSAPSGQVSGVPPITLGVTQQPGLKLGGSVSAPAAGGSIGYGGISSKPEVNVSTSASLLTGKTLAPTTTTGVALSLPVQESGTPAAVTSTTASTTASTGLQLSLPTTATAGTIATAGSAAGAVTQQDQGAASQTASMTYKDLEECINKWSHEFEEQERMFLHQATQINAWDRLLVENGEKITELNTDVDNVKIDQQRLSSELDFIVSQQKELEEMLVPLEKAFEQLPTSGSLAGAAAAGSHIRHADVERERTYQMAVNIDAQLKRLVEEMREVVDHLNASSAEASRESDPMQQITKILGAHMDSLQWIDRSMETLQKKVDDAGKLSEQLRRDQERSFRLAYS